MVTNAYQRYIASLVFTRESIAEIINRVLYFQFFGDRLKQKYLTVSKVSLISINYGLFFNNFIEIVYCIFVPY